MLLSNADENENLRLKALKDYEIMDTPPERELDDITRLASMMCETTICLISLLDETRQWFKSRVGFESRDKINTIAFCLHAIQQDDVFEVRDALQDDRFNRNPMVLNNPNIRFYAGMPLKTPTGFNIGTLCIIDTKPRILNSKQRSLLETLATQVITNFELRKINKELKEINKITMKLAKTKDDFLRNMSHELRTPLNAIYGFTEILNKTNLDSNQKEDVSIIKSSVEILVPIINDILDYCKLENGKLKLENNPFNLRDLIKGIYELLKIKAQEKDLSFKIKMERIIPFYIYGDRVRLNQILMNLLSNAIKFTSKGYVVLNIRLVKETQEDIEISFSVKDTGIGIPQEKLNEIFNRFEQAHGTTSVYGGTGLGLSITKSLVELHEGKINVKSVLGKGSEFYFNLRYPKLNDTEVNKLIHNENRQTLISYHCLNNLRVLLVEDYDVNIRLIEKIVEGKGIKLDTAKNGKICIDILKENKYDLILMDLQMPEMNGYEAASYLRNILHMDIPIIALSANISEIDKMKCLELGMNDYITKPFKVEQLFFAISICLSIKNIKVGKSENINLLNDPSNMLKTIRSLNSDSSPPQYRKLQNYLKCENKLKNILDYKTSDRKSKICSNDSFHSQGIILPEINEKSIKENVEIFEKINMQTFKEFTGDDKEFERELIEKFMLQIPEYLKDLQCEVFNENYLSIKKFAHKIKAPAAMFGLKELKIKLKEIEDLSENKEIFTILKIFSSCKAQLKENFKELNFILSQY